MSQTMADHREVHTHRESEGGREFSFWNSSNTTTIPSNIIDCYQLGGGNEASLNREEAMLREKNRKKNSKLEYSPFLPRSPRCSSASDPSRRKAIEEGRKELMEKMQGMPESSFELSFQDMVIDEKKLDQDKTSEEKTLMKVISSGSSKTLTKKPSNKKKSKSNRQNQISRVESMDSETFLLKMFFPTTLKKVVKVDNGSKVSPRPSLLESAKHVAKYWRVKSFFQNGINRSHTEHSLSENTITNHDKNRHFDRNISFSQRCWPFLHHTKTQKKKVGG